MHIHMAIASTTVERKFMGEVYTTSPFNPSPSEE
jgi:hypothetical protein